MHHKLSVVLILFALIPGLAYSQTVPSVEQNSKEEPAEHSPSPDADRTSLEKFPLNLGRNFLDLFSEKNFRPLVVGATGTAMLHAADEIIHNDFTKEDTGGVIATTGGFLGKPYVVLPAATGLMVWGHYSSNSRFRAFTYAMAQGYVLNTALTAGLKHTIQRTRPDKSDNFSFPSGHASSSFYIATVVAHHYGRKAGIIAYTAATFVAYSRLKKDVHWASDVGAGATLGYIVGSTVSRNSWPGQEQKKLTWIPVVDPRMRALGVSVTFRLP